MSTRGQKASVAAAVLPALLLLLPTRLHARWILPLFFNGNLWHYVPVRLLAPLVKSAQMYPAPEAKILEVGECPEISRGGGGGAPASGEYYWPTGRGRVESYSASPFPGVWNVSSAPAWSWHHPEGRWSTVPVGISIDGERAIYLTAADGLRKFSPDGELLWTYHRPFTYVDERINNAASIMDGLMFCATSIGRAFAVDMQTGREVWSSRVSWGGSGNYGWVSAHAGVVLLGADHKQGYRWGVQGCCGPADQTVFALNASSGCLLWTYAPDVPVWNYNFAFAGDGTFVFQDLEGRAYRNRLSDGSSIWKAGGSPNTWTDGSATLGSNGVVYAVDTKYMGSCLLGAEPPHPTSPKTCGSLYARRLEDGALLWRADVPRPPNNIPAVGRLFGGKGLSVVIPIGQQCQQGQRIDVYAFDAETGGLQWTFEGFRQEGPMVAGDLEGIEARRANRVQEMTMPNPWGAATIDSEGTVYVGGETGHFFALRDTNGDGRVSGEGEVATLDTGAAYVGSMGPALAPGLFVTADISTLYAWTVPSKS